MSRPGRPPTARPSISAFKEFWDAGDPGGAAKRIADILKTGVVVRGRACARAPRAATIRRTFRDGTQRFLQRVTTLDHAYTFVIPENYDPTRPYPVRVQLHGGANRLAPPDPARIGIDRLPGAIEEIKVFPIGVGDSRSGGSPRRSTTCRRILDRLKRTYNVDENRVYLTGISDGGTGVYFMAFRDTTPWASFLPLIGNMTVLANPDCRCRRRDLSGQRRRTSRSSSSMRDAIVCIRRTWCSRTSSISRSSARDVMFHVKPESEHSTTWWPEERGAFEAFVDDHPRDPLPDKISWETERTDRYNRAHWLVIDRLGDVAGRASCPTATCCTAAREYDFGLRINANVERGRRAVEIVAGSNAYRLGLRRRRSLLEVDGKPVRDRARHLREHAALGSRARRCGSPSSAAGQRLPLEGVFQPDGGRRAAGADFSREASRRAASIWRAAATSSRRPRAACVRSRCCCRRRNSISGGR